MRGSAGCGCPPRQARTRHGWGLTQRLAFSRDFAPGAFLCGRDRYNPSVKTVFCKHTATFILRSGLVGSQRSSSRTLLKPDAESLTARQVRVRADRLGLPSDEVLHVLDLGGVRPRSTEQVRFHRWSAPLPLTQLVSLEEDIFALGPELLLLDMARWADDVDLLLLCHELCGGYRIDRSRPEGIASRPPLTTVRALERVVERRSGVAGVRRLRRVLPFVGEGSESPMETALALIIGLPMSRGGLGAPRPVHNHRIDPGCRWRGVAEKGHYRCDLFWPEQRVAVEYDGELAHTGADRIAADARRRAALQAMGVTVISVTRDQLYRPASFRRLAKTLQLMLGVRPRARCADYAERQHALRARVLGYERDMGDISRLIRFG